jgi:hypothetical protein
MSPVAREHSFDELTRGMASGSISRGKALKLMGAALVGGTLASLGIGGIAAADEECKPEGKKCRKDEQCCSGTCSKIGTSRFGTCAAGCTSNGGTCSTSTDCCSGLVCKGPSGLRTCAESCIPPNAIGCDPNNPDSCPGGIVLGGCSCVGVSEGGGLCATTGAPFFPCSTSCDCPAGQICQPACECCVIAAEMCPRF